MYEAHEKERDCCEYRETDYKRHI